MEPQTFACKLRSLSMTTNQNPNDLLRRSNTLDGKANRKVRSRSFFYDVESSDDLPWECSSSKSMPADQKPKKSSTLDHKTNKKAKSQSTFYVAESPREHSPSVGSDLSSAYDSLYPKSRCYDDGDAADESNLSSRVPSADEGLDRVSNSDVGTSSNIRQCRSSMIPSRKHEEKFDKQRRSVNKEKDNMGTYCYQFRDKSETSDTESSIKIRIRIEKKTEWGGEEKVVVRRSIPVKEVIRFDDDDARTSRKLSPSDSLSQIPDLVSHEEVDVPPSLGPNDIQQTKSEICDRSDKSLPQPDVVSMSSPSDSWHSALDTSSESECGDEEPDSKHRKDQMYLIAEEIMSSERAYVNVIKLLNHVSSLTLFLSPLCSSVLTGHIRP